MVTSGDLVDAVLPAPEEEVDAAAEEIGLVAGFIVDGDDATFGDGAVTGPEFFYDADHVVGDVAHAECDPDSAGTARTTRIQKAGSGRTGEKGLVAINPLKDERIVVIAASRESDVRRRTLLIVPQ